MVTVKKKPPTPKTKPSSSMGDFESFRAKMLMLSEQDAPEPVENPASTAEVVKSIKLYYTQLPKNDKVYFMEIVKDPKFKNCYNVNFEFGKRGRGLTPGTKTKIAVTLAEAQRIYDAIVVEKKKEGYTENVSGVPFSR
jgi:WGR domain